MARVTTSNRQYDLVAGDLTQEEDHAEMQTFVDDDEGYVAWLRAHPESYVVNADRPPNASYVRLHRSTCRTVSGVPASGRAWTVTSTKVCGTRDELGGLGRGNDRRRRTVSLPHLHM